MFMYAQFLVKNPVSVKTARLCTGRDYTGRVRKYSATHGAMGAWSSHTKPTHTWVKSPHLFPLYEIKKDYSEGGLGY